MSESRKRRRQAVPLPELVESSNAMPKEYASIQGERIDQKEQGNKQANTKSRKSGHNISLPYAILIVLLICCGMFFVSKIDSKQENTGVNGRKTIDGFEYSVFEDGTATVLKYTGDKLDVNIPQSIEGYTITSLADNAFDDASKITRISLPDTILTLEKNPFSKCEELAYIHVSPDHPVFASLDGVLFSKTDKKLICCPPNYGASNYSWSYEIPDGIIIIGDSAFENCNLTYLDIPDSVTTIGQRAFYGCDRLDRLFLPFGVSLSAYAFAEMTSLESLYLTGVTVIPEGLLSGCSALRRVELWNDVSSIGDNSFYMCVSLSSIDVPKGVTYIGHGAFCGTAIYSITIPEGVTEINFNTFSLTRIRRIEIPEGVLRIEDMAFSSCETLTDIVLPSSIEFISEGAFHNCPKDAVFTVVQGSYAAQYCKENGMNYVYANGNNWLTP